MPIFFSTFHLFCTTSLPGLVGRMPLVRRLLCFPETVQENGHQACHDGQHEEGDSPCPQAGLVALDVPQSLGGDHVGEVQHEAQRPADVCVCCLRGDSTGHHPKVPLPGTSSSVCGAEGQLSRELSQLPFHGDQAVVNLILPAAAAQRAFLPPFPRAKGQLNVDDCSDPGVCSVTCT